MREEGAREIELSRGKKAIVDSEDYKGISQHKWYATQSLSGTWYARRTINGNNGINRTVWMPHEIIGKPKDGLQIDHINRNGLDNRKQNLRIVSCRGNQLNRKKQSKLFGAYRDKRCNRWWSKIKIHGKYKYLGMFRSQIGAHNAYIKALAEYKEEI